MRTEVDEPDRHDHRPGSDPRLMPGQGSWPYLPGQCPRCRYLQGFRPTFVDDSGYEILGFCRHPRISMELFRYQKHPASDAERCPLFVAQEARDTRDVS